MSENILECFLDIGSESYRFVSALSCTLATGKAAMPPECWRSTRFQRTGSIS